MCRGLHFVLAVLFHWVFTITSWGWCYHLASPASLWKLWHREVKLPNFTQLICNKVGIQKCYFDSRVWVLIPISSAFRVKELSVVASFWGTKFRKKSHTRTIVLRGLQNRLGSLWVPRFTQEAMETGTKTLCQRILPSENSDLEAV